MTNTSFRNIPSQLYLTSQSQHDGEADDAAITTRVATSLIDGNMIVDLALPQPLRITLTPEKLASGSITVMPYAPEIILPVKADWPPIALGVLTNVMTSQHRGDNGLQTTIVKLLVPYDDEADKVDVAAHFNQSIEMSLRMGKSDNLQVDSLMMGSFHVITLLMSNPGAMAFHYASIRDLRRLHESPLPVPQVAIAA